MAAKTTAQKLQEANHRIKDLKDLVSESKDEIGDLKQAVSEKDAEIRGLKLQKESDQRDLGRFRREIEGAEATINRAVEHLHQEIRDLRLMVRTAQGDTAFLDEEGVDFTRLDEEERIYRSVMDGLRMAASMLEYRASTVPAPPVEQPFLAEWRREILDAWAKDHDQVIG